MFSSRFVRLSVMLLALPLAIGAHPLPSKAVFKGEEINGIHIWPELENGILHIYAKAQPGSNYFKATGGEVLDVTKLVPLEAYKWEIKNGEMEFTEKKNFVEATTTFQSPKNKASNSLFGSLV